ncbi:MAG: phosphotransferase [Lachnospiraceae bacterium]|nr:phosphotransferase [Lachnospiraceae bacterium]
MFELTKENIIDYLKEKLPRFDFSNSVKVSKIGEGDDEAEGQGFINFMYKVTGKDFSLIVKQGLKKPRLESIKVVLPEERNLMEYESFRVRYGIIPKYVPKPYFQDMENHIFVMEDVSRLRIVRFIWNEDGILPDFGRQIGEFIAASSFYSSEFYLSREDFRELRNAFTNTKMRKILEDWIFLRKHDLGDSVDCKEFAELFDPECDPELMEACYELRRHYMSHEEALIHSDLHTSNIFADKDEMKVIDMEYTFAGPISFDLGYLLFNVIGQYCASGFRPYESFEQRRAFRMNMLETLSEVVTSFRKHFMEYWKKDAKSYYKEAPASFVEHFLDQMIPDLIGYAGIVNMYRLTSMHDYPDFDSIKDDESRIHAKKLCLLISKKMVLQRNEYHSMEELTRDILKIEGIYRKSI